MWTHNFWFDDGHITVATSIANAERHERSRCTTKSLFQHSLWHFKQSLHHGVIRRVAQLRSRQHRHDGAAQLHSDARPFKKGCYVTSCSKKWSALNVIFWGNAKRRVASKWGDSLIFRGEALFFRMEKDAQNLIFVFIFERKRNIFFMFFKTYFQKEKISIAQFENTLKRRAMGSFKIHTYAHTHTHTHTHTYIYIHTHTHTHTRNFSSCWHVHWLRFEAFQENIHETTALETLPTGKKEVNQVDVSSMWTLSPVFFILPFSSLLLPFGFHLFLLPLKTQNKEHVLFLSFPFGGFFFVSFLFIWKSTYFSFPFSSLFPLHFPRFFCV